MKRVNWGIVILILTTILLISGCSNSTTSSSRTAIADKPFQLPEEMQHITLPASFDIPVPTPTPTSHIFPLFKTDQKSTNLDLPVEAVATKRVSSSSEATISLTNGAELRIPAGAFSGEANVTLKKLTLDGPESKCTAVYRIETDSVTLKSLPTLVLPFDPLSIPKNVPEASLKVGLFDPGGGWTEVAAQIDMASGKASVKVPHFSVTDWFITWPDVFIKEIANKTKVILPVPYYTQGWSRWCWAASTQMILKNYGIGKEIWKIAEDFKAPYEEGLSSWSFAKGDYGNYFKNKGLKNIELSRLGWIDPSELTGYIMYQIRNGRPVWLGLPNIGHAIVVVGFDENRIYFNDPSGALLEFVKGIGKFDKRHLNPSSLTWNEWFTGAILGAPLKLLSSTFGFQTLVVMETPPASTPAVTMTVDNKDIEFRIPQVSGVGTHFENSFSWDGTKPNGQCFDGVNQLIYGLPDNNPGNSDTLTKFVVTLANSTTQNVTGTIQLLLDDKLLIEKRDIQLSPQTSNIQVDLMEKNPYSFLTNLIRPGSHQFKLSLTAGSAEMDNLTIPFAIGPAKPAGLKAERTDSTVHLSWEANPEEAKNLGDIEYVVWKDSKNIGTTANLKWEDKLPSGDTQQHNYNIEAIDVTNSNQANGWFTSVLSDKAIVNPLANAPTSQTSQLQQYREYWPDSKQVRWEYSYYTKTGNGIQGNTEVMQGVETKYWKDGTFIYRSNWKDGLKVGVYEEWFASGPVKVQGQYDEHGLAQGAWTFYYETGKVLEVRNFKDDKLVSISTPSAKP